MAETSTERLRRLLTLVPWLAAHSGVSKADAAEHFGLSVRQLEADLALVTVTGPGLYGGELVDIFFEDETITVADAQGLLQPLQLDADESASLLLGLRALQQLPDVDAGIVAGLVEKLAAAADEPLAVQVQPSPFAAVIAEAMHSRHDVRITYVHPVRDDVAERVVTPSEIVARDGVDYLTGYCHTAGAVRTFRLDRMRACELAGPTEERAPVVDGGAPRHRATVSVDPAQQYLLENVRTTALGEDEGRLLALVEYADEDWLVGWLVASGAGIRCVDPQHIDVRVRQAAAQGLAAYRRDT